MNQLALFFRPLSNRNRFLSRDPTLIIATSNTSLSAFERFLFYKSRMRGNAKQRAILRGSPRNGNMCKNGTDERLLFFFLMKALRQQCIRPVTMETRCCPKKLEFQRYAPKDFRSLAMSTNLRTCHKTRKKSFLGRSWAKIGLEKLSQMLIGSDEIPSPRQTSIDTTNDCAMKSERGALVRGSDPLSGHR